MASIDLWWLPLGAGGWFVRLNGRAYEALHALVERRRPLDLYHWGRDELGTGEIRIEASVPRGSAPRCKGTMAVRCGS